MGAPLKKELLLEAKSNFAKVGIDATKAAAGVNKLGTETKKAWSELDSFNARARNAKETQRKLADAQRKTASAVKENEERLRSQITTLGGWSLAIIGAAKTVDELSQKALMLSDVQRNLPFSIDKAANATQGLVDKLTLQQKAVQANTLGAAKSAKEFEQLTRVATKLARAQGLDATKGVEDFTTALSRGSPQILDNLGLTLKHSEAQRIFADHLGVSKEALTETEEAEAFRFAALKKGEEVIKDIALAEEGWALSVQKTKTELIDAGNALLRLTNRVGNYAAELNKATTAGEGFLSVSASDVFFGPLKEGATTIDDLTSSILGLDKALASPVVERGFEGLENVTKKISIEARETAMAYNDLAIAITAAANLDATVQQQFKKHRPKRRRSSSLEKIDLDANRRFNLQADSDLNELREQTSGTGTDKVIADAEARFDRINQLRERDLERAVEHAEQTREMRLQQLEIDRELGLDPAMAMEREAEIAEAHHQRMLDAQAQFMGNKQAVEETAHAAKLARLKAERAAEKKSMDDVRKGFEVYQGVANNTAQTAALVAEATGMSAGKAARMQNRFLGMQAFGRAALELVESIAAAARYDYGAAALHGTAAALGVVKGGLLVSGALDPSGGGSGGGGDSAFASGSALGSGPAANDGGGSNTVGSAGNLPRGPVSRPQAAPQGGQNTAPSNSGGRTTTVNIGTVNTLATSDEELGVKLRTVIQDSESNVGAA